MAQITSITDNSIFGLKVNETFTLIKEYWYNGECWVKVKDSAGKTHKFPDCFFSFGAK